jgi:uncharacterized damage-inducible protein DinB
MNWTKLLETEIESTYGATEGLIKLVDKDKLSWKPATGNNWMTTGQLLQHITEACGMCCKGFVTGDWGMPADAPPEDMLPAAEKLPTVKSVKEALDKLAADKKVAVEMVKKVGEKDLAAKSVAAPWDPTPHPLGRQLLHMVGHLNQHKGQLFYYLKLQGKPVNTMNLWGGG